MSASSLPPRRPALVVGVDFRSRSGPAVRHALGMLACGAVSEAHLVHVLAPESAREPHFAAHVPDALADVALTHLPHGVRGVWAHVRDGDPCLEIRRLAFDVGADLVVIGPPRDGDLDRYRPFSVLVAGRSLTMEGRGFQAARCDACLRARASGLAPAPFCARHVRPGAHARPVIAGEREARVLH